MRLLLFLAGLAMASSAAMTWLEPPFAGPEVSPFSWIFDQGAEVVEWNRWPVWVFIAGFVLAAVTALCALAGRSWGLVAIFAGATPLVLAINFVATARETLTDFGLPFRIDLNDLGQAWRLMEDFIRLGFWLYCGGAALLLAVGLALVFGRR